MLRQSAFALPDGVEVPVYSFNTVIVGSGAAGMNCAAHLYESMTAKGIERPQDRIAIVTAGAHLGASRMSGSDKQTYYKLGTSATVADSASDFAQALTTFGCCHGDVALAEAQCSLREFYHLVQAGVPFPHDAEGGYVGYKTDHDPRERATSVGPKTSKYMSECLQKQTDRYGIRIFDMHEVAHLIKGDKGRIVGILTLDSHRIADPSFGLTIFLCENLVLAAGGPGELYATSVYPEGQTGIHGLALAAGLKAHNLTESQFGLASTKFRWNVSGTYMQVVPRVFSTDAEGGDEREFLAPHFDSTARMGTNIFLKGYQWPFDPQRILNQQSSLIDVLVYYETQVLKRRVFLDFTRNPIPGAGGEPFDLAAMDGEAYEYLRRNKALQSTPIERLEQMNPLAIEIYSEHGIDIRSEPLEIDVCAQHHNGGFVVDKWWQSNIPHTFVIGEMAGTHGVKRPGGSALNAGQVGGLRAAEYVANVYGGDVPVDKLSKHGKDQLISLYQRFQDLQASSHGITPQQAIFDIKRRMSLHAGHIRQLDMVKSAKYEAANLYRTLHKGDVRLAERRDLVKAIRAQHLALAHVGFLTAIEEYIESGGGSRGSFMIIGDDGDVISPKLVNPRTGKPLAFVPENEELRETIAEVELIDAQSPAFGVQRVPVRRIPVREEAFELAWAKFRSGEVYRR